MVARLFLFSNINKQMKLRLFLLLMSLATLSAYADDARIVIKQKSGSETILELSTHPVITFSGEDMVVTSDFTSISIPLDLIDCYTAYDDATGIEPIVTPPLYANGHVVFRSLPKGTEVRVYTVEGHLVRSQPADDFGQTDISLDMLPKGVYVISTPACKIKIINK